MSDGLRVLLTAFAACGLVIFGLTVITASGYDRAIDWFLFATPVILMGGVVSEGFN